MPFRALKFSQESHVFSVPACTLVLNRNCVFFLGFLVKAVLRKKRAKNFRILQKNPKKDIRSCWLTAQLTS